MLYATCFVNYNNPRIGEATRAVLARNGVETEVLYPRCCGMPQLEQGNLAAVAASARRVAAALGPWIDKGYDIIALVPSCALMLKFEWPLIVPGDPAVEKLSVLLYVAGGGFAKTTGCSGVLSRPSSRPTGPGCGENPSRCA